MNIQLAKFDREYMLTLRLSTDLPNIKSVPGFPLCCLLHAFKMSQHTFLLMIFFLFLNTSKYFQKG